jgi:hypothetical protein
MNTKRTPMVKWAEARHSVHAPLHTGTRIAIFLRAGQAPSRITPVPSPPEARDAGALRFEQAAVTVALLAGFVFGVPLVVPVAAVLLAAALVAGPRANLFARAYRAAMASRASSNRPGEAPEVTRLTRIVEVALLVLGSVPVAFGIEGLAWVFALPVAAITGLAATTGINLVALVRDR